MPRRKPAGTFPREPRSPLEPSGGREYLAIALASAAVMLYEIGVTRILSVVLWYHFAFLAVSLAMLGLGVPGVWFALRPPGPRSLPRALAVAALTAPLSIIALFMYGGPLPQRTALATVCVLVPMLALGSAVCALLLRARGKEIGRMYAADLFGATLAAIAVVPFMRVIPTPLIVAGSGLLPVLALAALRKSRMAMVVSIGVVALLAWPGALHVRYGKVYSEKGLNVLYERWTPTARLTVISTAFQQRAFGWGMGSRYVPRQVDQVWLEQDGAAGTPITHVTGAPGERDHLYYDVTSLADQLQPPSHACVIGAGGGRDVLTALGAGASDVDAVEMNPFIVQLVSTQFGAYSGDIYHAPGVHAVVSEGRSYLARMAKKYDLIQISLIDSWAATAAGAYALSENYLYTLEAYRLYWNRLTPTGILSTSRWISSLEAVRLANLVREALSREHVADPSTHLAIAQGGQVATVLASREPFTGARLDSLRAVCERRGFTLLWPADATQPDSIGVGLVLAKGDGAFKARGFDVSVPVDDRPFFFHSVEVFGGQLPADAKSFLNNARAVLVLRRLMEIVTLLAVVLFFLPFAFGKALPRERGFWRGSAYFAAIGFGFMLVELPVIQRMILYLGHPSHAITVVLASMLCGAGLGSILAERLRGRAIVVWAVLLAAVVAAANIGIPHLVTATIGWAWAARVIAASLATGTLGLLMGVALPLGMLKFGDVAKPWFWAVNGACGVTASVCSLGLAMTFGFERVVWGGVVFYAIAAVLLAGFEGVTNQTRAERGAAPLPPPAPQRAGTVARGSCPASLAPSPACRPRACADRP